MGENRQIVINANENGCKLYHRELNRKIREAIQNGYKHIILKNIMGQRFIGAGIKDDVVIEIYGDAGLDLGVFFGGKQIIVHGCSEYLLGNTLNGGEIVVYGDSWDITGMGARDGKIFVMGNGGSRVGIHMKEYKDKKPVICYGGKVKQYCGEYMAGGIIVILGLDFREAIIDRKKPLDRDNIDPSKIKNYDDPIVQSDIGGGIHGGAIYVRGEVPKEYLGVYAVKEKATNADKRILKPIIKRFCELFNCPEDLIWQKEFTKIRPISSRPFGKHYSTVPI
jgi:glutamate synthase domain-containing protein 3